MRTKCQIQIKRVYDEPAATDGFRILVDRLWPRGVTKEKAHVDLWLKDVAPSDELRKWSHHDPAKWKEFRQRYREELKEKPEQLVWLREKASEETLTLVYAASDTEHNNAVALRELLIP